MSAPTKQKNLTLVAAGLLILALGGAGGVWWAKRSPNMEPTSAESAKPERKVLYWYDPMKPDAKFDKPGPSPFMDMQLVPRYADHGGTDAAALTISTRASQSLGIRVATVDRTFPAPLRSLEPCNSANVMSASSKPAPVALWCGFTPARLAMSSRRAAHWSTSPIRNG